MKLARMWIALGGIVFAGGAVQLLADTIPDPTMTFNVPGHHSFDLSNCTTFFPFCTFEVGVVGPDGFATTDLDIKNDTDMVVTQLKFFIPTTNFDQLFVAHTNTFVKANIYFDKRGKDFPSLDLDLGPVTIVDFSGIGNEQINGGSAYRFGCWDHRRRWEGDDARDCTSGAPGFVDGGIIVAEAFFAEDAPPLYPGLQPGADGSLDLTPNIPEPATFVLFLSAAGVLAIGRKFRRR